MHPEMGESEIVLNLYIEARWHEVEIVCVYFTGKWMSSGVSLVYEAKGGS